MKEKKGYFVVSLDFELFWGMFDKETIESYGARIRGERTAIPRMLELFTEYGMHATWATVGMLMARSRTEIESLLPSSDLRPVYKDQAISAYQHLATSDVGNNEDDDEYHYGSTLVQKILKAPFQEIGNHTFSHFYCVDGNQNDAKIFAADIDAFNQVAASYGLHATSIVFPRNQTTDAALRVCLQNGIRAYRGNEKHFLYKARGDSEQNLFIRGLRLLDHYFNFSGHHTYTPQKAIGSSLFNIPSSRFLRPWSRTLSFLEPLRMRRIKNSMTHAAKKGETFHLWWHPHNFGIDQEQNFKNLTIILDHYKMLAEKYGMQSASMGELAKSFDAPTP